MATNSKFTDAEPRCFKTAEQKLGNNEQWIENSDSSNAKLLYSTSIETGEEFLGDCVCLFLFILFFNLGSYPGYMLHFGATSLHFGAKIFHLSQIWETKIANLDGICNIFGFHPCSHRFQGCLDCFFIIFLMVFNDFVHGFIFSSFWSIFSMVFLDFFECI